MSISLLYLDLKIGLISSKVASANKFPIVVSHLPFDLSIVTELKEITLPKSLSMCSRYGVTKSSTVLILPKLAVTSMFLAFIEVFWYEVLLQDVSVRHVDKAKLPIKKSFLFLGFVIRISLVF